MSRTVNILAAVFIWCLIAAYIVVSGWYARERRGEVHVRNLRIAVTDTAGLKVITAAKVTRWLGEAGLEPVGLPIDYIDTRFIERQLSIYPEVKHVSAWTDLDGNLNVRIEPRIPIMRVRTDDYRFWLFRDGYILPERGEFTAYVPVVTGGAVQFPFSPTDEGSYDQLLQDSYDGFLSRYTAIARERASLRERLRAVHSDIPVVEASRPRRWWSQRRRDEFDETRRLRLSDLSAAAREIPLRITELERLEASLREKEKKSYKSHRFWRKLANFAEFVANDRFWSDQVVQIVVGERGVELVPRAGDHLILLGELDGGEVDRLANLRAFYQRGLWFDGWERYSVLDARYVNQIVCTK